MGMIQPDELRTERPYGPCGSRGCDVWDVIWPVRPLAVTWPPCGDCLMRDPDVARYHQPIHFARARPQGHASQRDPFPSKSASDEGGWVVRLTDSRQTLAKTYRLDRGGGAVLKAEGDTHLLQSSAEQRDTPTFCDGRHVGLDESHQG